MARNARQRAAPTGDLHPVLTADVTAEARSSLSLCQEVDVIREPLKFRHQVIDADPPGSHHDITLIADINGDGRNEIIIGGKQGPPNLFWYENPSWRRHAMADAPDLEAGGLVFDINRDGRPDIVAGQQWGGRELYWFENPPDPRQPWPRHLIESRFNKYHDQAIGDIDGDGEPELIVLSQKTGVLVYYDIPDDPYQEPWPRTCCHLIAQFTDDRIEGLRVADVDNTGQPAILVGPNIYRMSAQRRWEVESFASDFIMTRTAAADLTGDGCMDIVLCEGESHPGRLAICSPPGRKPRILRDDLFHPHSLEIADFDFDGRPDIFVAEMGLGRNPSPRMFIYRNLGDGQFEETLIQVGVPTHEAKVADMTGDGRPDIVGKAYDPQRHVDVWFNET
jgi:hypothetical protein